MCQWRLIFVVGGRYRSRAGGGIFLVNPSARQEMADASADQDGSITRLPVNKISKVEGIAAFAVLFGFVVTLQALGGAYASGFGGFPDEPAHLVTSLMARDFIAGLDFRHPWQFAQQYYFHYPKVMIGIWPPVFYGALGLWFLIVGASRSSAIMFIAIVATTTACIIYFSGRRLIGRW